MATAALLNFSLSHFSFPLSPAAASNMHVTRPKSAKGRTRPSLSYSPSVDACPCRAPPSPPPPHDSANTRRALSTKPAFPASRVSPEELPELLQQVPLRTSCSLNKYRVLPSIGAVEALAEQTTQLQVSGARGDALRSRTLPGERGSASASSGSDVPGGGGSRQQCPPQKLRRNMRQESPSTSTLSLEEPWKEESRLLLAIRSPSGQRFEHHFKPTDSLQMVLTVAEQKMSTQYKRCSVETMEVPRRSFSDLTRSLWECGILHKSVLCIRQKEQQDAEL